MQDQAEQLRQMMRGRGGGNNGAAPVRNRTRIIAVSSGKGGVGKTNISTALAIAYAKIGKKVILLDADLGLANVNVVMGIIPKYNLYHLMERQRSIKEIILDTEYGVKIVAGASGFSKIANLGEEEREYFIEEMSQLSNADIVIMVHPDYQYTPKLVPAMASMLAFGEYDAVIASRFIGKGALEGGMPLYKFWANKFLTFFQNILMKERLTEYHTGFRAFTREVLEKLPLKDCNDDFIFDNEMLALIFYKGYTVGQISCPTKYFPDASSINFMRSCKYGFGVLGVSIKYLLAKTGIYKSAIFKNDAKTLNPEEKLPYYEN